ncbi:MAG: hypothetical protein M1132_10265 [Chloroflexi bacterium]|nr:hypothetical protein [Chloroflexota bacterium]
MRIVRIIGVLRGVRAARVSSRFVMERRTQSTSHAATLLAGVLASWFLAPAEAQPEDELTALRKELAEVKQLLVALDRQSAPSP